MSAPFLSSEEYDERAHALYNEGRYDEALAMLKEAVERYPDAVELQVGMGYARLARDEYAWARRAFEQALVLDPEHEDALAGMGEVLLALGETERAMRVFGTTIALGYDDDAELMLQIGRALFREGFADEALTFFERAALQVPDSAEAASCVGYAHHRLGHEEEAVRALRQALTLDDGFTEARVYLANILFEAGDLDGALREFERTTPEDHWDDLGIMRLLELKTQLLKLPDTDPERAPWEARLVELTGEPDPIDALLAEVEQHVLEEEDAAAAGAQAQLETLGGLLTGLQQQHPVGTELQEATATDVIAEEGPHRIVTLDGIEYEGSWDDIVRALRDARDAGRPVDEYMAREARRHYGATGTRIASHAPEAFLRESASAGLLRILR